MWNFRYESEKSVKCDIAEYEMIKYEIINGIQRVGKNK